MADNILQDRYQIQRPLGERYDQQTLLALDQKSGELVVVKLLLFHHRFQWETLKLFEREAKTLKGLSHPAIPRYIDYFDVDTESAKGFAFVQSYIDAPSLAEHAKAGRSFSEDELKQIAKAVLDVLTYLHDRHPPIIHRDIKPSNILLGDRSGHSAGHVYLVDFGSVQAVAHEGGTRTIVGTYGYMAPEQFGERAVPASDLYGLGTTLIYLTSGQHPADLPQKSLRICFESYVQLSPAFTDWLQWMTEPALEQRLDSARHAGHALETETVRTLQTDFFAAGSELSPIPTKPVNSKVVVKKSHRSLDIHIPSKGMNFRIARRITSAIIASAVFFIFFAFGLGLFTLGWQGIISGVIWCSIVLSVTVGALIILILFPLFGTVWLHIDHKKLKLYYQVLGIKYRHFSVSKESISKVEKTPIFYEMLPSNGYYKKQYPEIRLWFKHTRKIRVARDEFLSDSELSWLAYEISEWLGVPLIQGE